MLAEADVEALLISSLLESLSLFSLAAVTARFRFLEDCHIIVTLQFKG